MTPLILIGGGGHCKSVIEAAESSGQWKIAGILDTADKVGTTVLGYPVIGTDDDIPNLIAANRDCRFVITVGHIKTAGIRRRIAARVMEEKGLFATIVASTAHVTLQQI